MKVNMSWNCCMWLRITTLTFVISAQSLYIPRLPHDKILHSSNVHALPLRSKPRSDDLSIIKASNNPSTPLHVLRETDLRCAQRTCGRQTLYPGKTAQAAVVESLATYRILYELKSATC